MTGPPSKPTLKRYTWVRWHHELTYLPLWALVAQRAGVTQPLVEAFVQRLEVHASGSRPRGSVEDFSVAALAASWRIEEEQLARIRVALEQPDIRWIEQDHIVTFWERNPDEEDPTAAQRQQRKRDRRNAMRELARQASLGLISPAVRTEREFTIQSHRYPLQQMAAWARLSTGEGVTDRDGRDSVTITARAEQTNLDGPAVDNSGDVGPGAKEELSGEGVDAGADDPQAQARRWMAIEGRRLVIERMPNEQPGRVDTLLERWRDQDLDGDAVGLMTAILECTRMRHAGATFHVAITQACARYRRQRAAEREPQATLPLGGLQALKRGGANG